MTGIPRVSWAECERQFHLSCKASHENQFCVGTESISVFVGQLIQRHGRAEMWESVSVYAHKDEDGTLVVRVMVFNPDWDGPLQVARVLGTQGASPLLAATWTTSQFDEPNAENHSEKLSYGGSIAMPLGYCKARVRRMRGRKTDQDETKAPSEPETDGN